MERLRFPGVLEIITGKFVRHSRAYYEWRLVDRQRELEAMPGDAALSDDLAVAYAKLGRPDEGIAVLRPVLAANPERYETISNLGTLLFFAGKLDDSKEHIRRALEINPNAHFGRERYQLLLTEYLQQSEHASNGVMSTEEKNPLHKPVGFARYAIEERLKATGQIVAGGSLSPEDSAEVKRAGKGVLGMMHFADFQSPILLEALGDLLITGEMEENSTLLAARAYLRAENATKAANDPAAAAHFREMAKQAISNHIDFEKGLKLSDLESQLAKEVAAADSWFTTIERQEKQWIAEGRDVDRQFAAVYYDSLDKTIAEAESQVRSEKRDVRLSQQSQENQMFASAILVLLAAVVAFAGVVAVIIIWLRRRSIVDFRTSPPKKPLSA